MPSVARLSTQQKWGLVAVVSVVVGGGVLLVVETRTSGRLERSKTCDDVDVEPGGTRFRSPPPPSGDGAGGTPPDPSGGSFEADPAFRPAPARLVYCEDFADPFVLSADTLFGARLFAYATNTAHAFVPVLSSESVVRSEDIAAALPELPAWAEPGAVWAPAVLARSDDDLVMYYTTTDRASGRQCISSATSADPVGPFVDRSSAPMVCPVPLGGAIDPSPFVATDGTVYLLWKNDGNCCGVPTRLWSQRLAEDRLAVEGQPSELLGADQPWEGQLVEGPSLIEHDGDHYLFYSANAWDSDRYAIGYATCEGPVGPCTKPLSEPWLASSEQALGPGGQEFFRSGDDELRMVFHAWAFGKVGYREGGFRSLFTTGIEFADRRPVVVE